MNTLFKFVLKQITKLRYSLLWHTSTSYEYYDVLDILGIYLDCSKILSISNSDYFCCITFLDNSRLEFRCDKKWNAWMYSGVMRFSNGKTMKWEEKMPSCEVLYKYKKIFLNYNKKEVKREKESEKLKYYNCLPVTYLRKQKLKHINKY